MRSAFNLLAATSDSTRAALTRSSARYMTDKLALIAKGAQPLTKTCASPPPCHAADRGECSRVTGDVGQYRTDCGTDLVELALCLSPRQSLCGETKLQKAPKPMPGEGWLSRMGARYLHKDMQGKHRSMRHGSTKSADETERIRRVVRGLA